MNQHIHCIVSDCHYYEQGNKCVANEILVSTDNFAIEQPDHIDANIAKKLTPASAAGNCMSTACKTYVTKGSKKINDEGVTRMS